MLTPTDYLSKIIRHLLMAQAKSVMVVEVTAPAWLHRFIIGKKGQNIGRITQQLPRVRRQ